MSPRGARNRVDDPFVVSHPASPFRKVSKDTHAGQISNTFRAAMLVRHWWSLQASYIVARTQSVTPRTVSQTAANATVRTMTATSRAIKSSRPSSSR